MYHRWCEKLGAKINARFSQLSWYYADVGDEGFPMKIERTRLAVDSPDLNRGLIQVFQIQ